MNFKKIAVVMTKDTKTESVYRKIQRFFQKFYFKQKDLAKIIIWVLNIKWPYFLSMDRTNWKFWKVNINILTIGIVYKKIAFPIAWMLLNKRWNSNFNERKKCLQKAIKLIWKENIKWLLADREFIWQEWFDYLLNEEIPFWIRIRNNFKLLNWKSVKIFFKWVWKKAKYIDKKITICWVEVYLTAIKVKNELMVIASNKRWSNSINIYLKRWWIEVLFWCLKKRWFNFEDTHLTDYKKISMLIWILWITFTWCHKMWEEREKQEPIKIKKHWRKAVSIFRYWLEFMQIIFFDFKRKIRDFNIAMKILSCT